MLEENPDSDDEYGPGSNSGDEEVGERDAVGEGDTVVE